MTDRGQFYCFKDGALAPISSEPTSEVQLAVADSWLVTDGRVLDLEGHYRRFSDWVSATHPEYAAQLESFFEAVNAAIPRTGRWFPRIEFHAEAKAPNVFYLRLREAPEQLTGITLWTFPTPDPRSKPTIKGPDLSLGMQMRRNAQMHGADEAVLLNSNGKILEGALSAIVWWRGEVLCAPDDTLPWLPSITRKLVFEIASQMGVRTRLERSKPADLVGLEIWALSSLQGIRAVTDWVNLGAPVGKGSHLDAFQKRLRLLAKAID